MLELNGLKKKKHTQLRISFKNFNNTRICFHLTQNICGYHDYHCMSAAFHDMYLTTLIMIEHWFHSLSFRAYPIQVFIRTNGFPYIPCSTPHGRPSTTQTCTVDADTPCAYSHLREIMTTHTERAIICTEGDNSTIMIHSSSVKIKTKITNLFYAKHFIQQYAHMTIFINLALTRRNLLN